jgi:hypothetical protein
MVAVKAECLVDLTADWKVEKEHLTAALKVEWTGNLKAVQRVEPWARSMAAYLDLKRIYAYLFEKQWSNYFKIKFKLLNVPFGK